MNTGILRVDPLFETGAPSPTRACMVTFGPGARTGWQSHPLCRTLIVLAGHGRVRRSGGPVEHVSSGDIIHFSPGEKHWHGGTSEGGATHITITRLPEEPGDEA